MVQFGQCPTCRALYEFEPDAVGQTIQCECDTTLYVSDASSHPEIPLACTHCAGQYAVDSSAIGESVQCECGNQMTVPGIVLCPPLENTPQQLRAAIQTPHEDDSRASVSCPRCERGYHAEPSDDQQTAICKCGCRFRITLNGDRFETFETPPEAADRNAASPETSRRKKKPISLVSIVGLAAVALLLLISIIMFATRNASQADSADQQAGSNRQESKKSITATTPQKLATVDDFGDPITQSVQPIPTPHITSAQNRTNAPDATWVASFLAAPPTPEIPQASAPRERIEIIRAPTAGLTFDRIYELAYQAYSDAKAPSATRKQIGTAIGLLETAAQMAPRDTDEARNALNQIRYLLAYMYHKGGHLVEAAIVGSGVAASGDSKEPATREAAMIALAAAQEANATQWGSKTNAAELELMRSVAEVIAKRWPNQPQLNSIWMDLGQRYRGFGNRPSAATAFARVTKQAELYSEANLAAGSVLWAEYRLRHAKGRSEPQMLNRAARHLQDGIRSLADQDPMPLQAISAKLSLSRIAILDGDYQQAEAWLTQGPSPLVELPEPGNGDSLIPPPLYENIHRTMLAIARQSGNATDVMTSINRLSASGSDNAGEKLMLGVVKDQISASLSKSVLTPDDFSTLDSLVNSLLQKQKSVDANGVLWVAESWGKLADRAANSELANQCLVRAEATYAAAMARDDFPSASVQSATLRRAQLLRSAGRLDDAIPLLKSILDQEPNAFGLQIEIADILQQTAIQSGDPANLLIAINGTSDGNIWGWAKLTTTLHSAEPTDETRDRLLSCQFNLLRCRLVLAKSVTDTAQRSNEMDKLKQQLDRVLATTNPERNPWYDRLKKLRSSVDQ